MLPCSLKVSEKDSLRAVKPCECPWFSSRRTERVPGGHVAVCTARAMRAVFSLSKSPPSTRFRQVTGKLTLQHYGGLAPSSRHLCGLLDECLGGDNRPIALNDPEGPVSKELYSLSVGFSSGGGAAHPAWILAGHSQCGTPVR
jgi:hypothetical protein